MQLLKFAVIRRGSSYRQTRRPPSPWGLALHLYCLKCMKFGHLILRRIKIVATRCQILRLKCTKFDYGWGSA